MTKKKSLFLKIGCLILALGIAIIPFFSFRTKDVVKADSVTSSYTFNSSNVITVTNTVYDVNDRYSFWGISLYSFDITTDSSGIHFRVYGNVLSRYTNDGIGSVFPVDSNYTYSSDGYYRAYLTPSDANHFYTPIHVSVSSSDFVANIYKIRIYSERVSSNLRTYIIYYDVNDNYINFSIELHQNNGTFSDIPFSFMYSDRTYFISDIELTDNQLYQSGYGQGNTDGYDRGYTQGTSDGYTNGYNAGYGAGTNHGIETASDYSFLSLIGAVVDAPIKAFTGLFNFNILGVNLSSFFFGLFTIALTIAIIRVIKF